VAKQAAKAEIFRAIEKGGKRHWKQQRQKQGKE
jgi:hypothetical protein